MSIYKKCPSSFHGKIDEIPGISVDNFTGDNAKSRAYFISHFHADHIQGIDDPRLLEHLKKTNVFIYTSEITLTIMRHKVTDNELLQYVQALSEGSNMITLPTVAEDHSEEISLEVILIPAEHCLGSCMFLFKTTTQSILYTGDFRISNNDIEKYEKLRDPNGDPINIDVMYVDTTFIDEKYEEFPTRNDTIDMVIDEIDKWLKNGDNYAVAIYVYANYTHEFICNQIYEKLNIKVYVDDGQWKLYSEIPELVPGITNDESKTRIHLCKYKSGEYSQRLCNVCQNYEKNLYVYLTAMQWKNYNVNLTKPKLRTEPTRLDACFATHCSRREVINFVNYFKKPEVKGFPNRYVAETPN